jgi:hypothetical protein
MEKIYSEKKNSCNLTQVSPDTIHFLLQYSKALRIRKHRQFSFETVLN